MQIRSGLTAAKRGAKTTVNRVMGLLGARVLMDWERRVLDARYHDVVSDLEATYATHIFPGIGSSKGRVGLLCNLVGTSVPEALHLLHYLHEAAESTGDVCELGVAQGATSALIANELLDSDRTLWLYDSFEGLSNPTREDELIDDIFELGSMHQYASTMAFPAQEVRRRLDAVDFPRERTRIVPGYIRADLEPDLLPAEVAFAYLDFDLFEPILVGLRLMHDRSRPGTVLMVDDYGYFSSGVETAVRQFLSEHEGSYDLLQPPPTAGHFCVLRRR